MEGWPRSEVALLEMVLVRATHLKVVRGSQQHFYKSLLIVVKSQDG